MAATGGYNAAKATDVSGKVSWSHGPSEEELKEAGVWPLDEHNIKLLDNVRPRGWQNPTPAADFEYDIIAIGAGAAGLVTAKQSARRGAKSALIEKHLAGGDCLNVGCVPSKALLRASRAIAERKRLDLGIPPQEDLQVDFAKIMARLRAGRAKIAPADSYEGTMGAGADMYQGGAVFKGPGEVEVRGQILRFRKAVICSGGRAMVPPIPGLKEAPYVTNASFFNLTTLPPRLCVVGAGPIGCEMAQAFARFGSKVTVVDMLPLPMGPEDQDAAKVLKDVLEEDGVNFVLQAKCEKVEHVPAKDGNAWPTITLTAGGQRIECDSLLIACGRVPNVDGLGLEAAGVEFHNMRGITVDDELRTSNPNIYAIGDCCAIPTARFTHTSGAMATMVVQNALFGSGLPSMAPSLKMSEMAIPRCTFTEPECASVGHNSGSAERAGVEVDIYTSSLDHNDRCILEGAREGGFVRVFCKKGTDEIVGGVIVAERAGDMLAEITLAMQHKIPFGAVGRTVHPYPTMGEGVQQCALNWTRANWERFTRQ